MASVTKLRKCVITVAKLSADYETECRMLENNTTGLERAKNERIVDSQYNNFLRQQQDSKKALSASKSTTTADDDQEKKWRFRNQFQGNCFNCGKKGHRVEECSSTKKEIESSELLPIRRAEVGASATSAGVRSTLRTSTGICAKVLSTGLTIVRSEELRRARYWQK